MTTDQIKSESSKTAQQETCTAAIDWQVIISYCLLCYGVNGLLIKFYLGGVIAENQGPPPPEFQAGIFFLTSPVSLPIYLACSAIYWLVTGLCEFGGLLL